MKLVFGIPSAFCSARAIEQICMAVGDKHTVVVHHDFSKQPNFSLASRNADVIDDPVVTDWGGWGFIQAILKILERSYRKFEFDYFQLLSDTSLPIRPINEFESFLELEQPDASFDALSLNSEDSLALLNYAYCYYPRNRLEKTLMRRLAKLVLMPQDSNLPREERGGVAMDKARPSGLLVDVAFFLHGALVRNAQRSLPMKHGCLYCGTTYFGVSRKLLGRMLEEYRNSRALADHYRKNAQVKDEGIFPTLIMLAGPRRVTGSNHYLRWTQRRTGPDELGEADITALRDSGKFFARKFPGDPDSKIRRMVLSELLRIPAGNPIAKN